MSVNRRNFIKSALAITCGGIINSCTLNKHSGISTEMNNEKQLNIYSWTDYIHPDCIPEFERRYGVKITYDTVASNEALMAKIEAGASGYDIIVPSSYAVHKLKELDLLLPIEHDRLKNFDNIMPRFKQSKFDPACSVSIPYTYGTTGIAYNELAFKNKSGLPTDWDSFWDKKLANRMTLLEDARETIGFALKRRGYSLNSRNEVEIKEAIDDLKNQKNLLMSYTSDQVIQNLASGDALLALAYSGDAQQAHKYNDNLHYIIPRSGAAMWIDNMCIPKNAPHPGYAHLWLDFMMESQVAAKISNFCFYASPNKAAQKFINPDFLANKHLYPDDEILDKCEELDDLGKFTLVYDKYWTELKCY